MKDRIKRGALWLLLSLLFLIPILAQTQQNPPPLTVVPPPQGRLTLVSGAPVQNADRTSTNTLYYDSYNGNKIPFWRGSYPVLFSIPNNEISLTLDTTNHVNAKLYDVFAIYDGTTVRLCTGPAWSTTVVRGTGAGTTQIENLTAGFWTNANILTSCWNNSANYGPIPVNNGTYLGSFYTTSAGNTQALYTPAGAAGGTNNCICYWNAYNRVRVVSRILDTTATWVVSSTTYAALNTSNSNRLWWVDGLQQTNLECRLTTYNTVSAAQATSGMDIDVQNAAPDQSINVGVNGTSGVATTFGMPLLGLHYCSGVQAATAASVTFFGFAAGPPARQLTAMYLVEDQ